MKLTNKVALISGLGCLALVGSGFAAWTYATNAENTYNAGADVSAKVLTAGNVTFVKNDLSFVLDEADGHLIEGTTHAPSLETGTLKMGYITWSGSLSFKYVRPTTVTTATKVTFSAVVSVPGAGAAGTLSYYVDFLNESTHSQSQTLDFGGTQYDAGTEVTVDASTLKLAPIQDASVAANNHMPQTSGAYDTMKTAFDLAASVVSFKVTATVVNA